MYLLLMLYVFVGTVVYFMNRIETDNSIKESTKNAITWPWLWFKMFLEELKDARP